MWFLRRYRPNNLYIYLFPMLLITSLYVTFYDKELSKLFVNKFHENFFNRTTPVSSNDYLNVRLNLSSNTAICHMDDILIIYILSTIDNFDRRNIIRSTWASPLIGTCFVFILGRTEQSTLTHLLVEREKRQYKDIVQIDHLESYANVVYKEVAALHWSSHFYQSIPYLFKTDDDLIVDSLLVSSIAQLLVTSRRNDSTYISKHRPALISEVLSLDRKTLFRGGWSMEFQPALRDGKFGVSEYVWPHTTLPPYCSGFGWLMSKDVRNRLVQASLTYPVNKTAWIGDVFVSGFLANAANVRCQGISIDYDQTFSGNCSCFMAQRPMLTVCSSTYHGGGGGGGNVTVKFSEYGNAWKVIQERHHNVDNRTMRDSKEC